MGTKRSVLPLAAIGAYRDDKLRPYVFQAVNDVRTQAERRLLDDPSINKEYLPILGHRGLRASAAELSLGEDHPALVERRVATAQALGGTGALRVVFAFLHRSLPDRPVYVSNPTWGNHHQLLAHVGYSKESIRSYEYLTGGGDGQMPALNGAGIVETLTRAPEGSIILLHACGHNPSGLDPSPELWEEISSVCDERSHIPVFDMAYQGFASGDVEEDARAVRLVSQRLSTPTFVCQSFSKNFGLYSERVGAVQVVATSTEEAATIESHLEDLIRPMYSNPPSHGALVVSTILRDPALRDGWLRELKQASDRVNAMREALYDALQRRHTPGDWGKLREGKGLFAMLGLSKEQCQTMVDEQHVYLLENARISLAGLNAEKVELLADLMHRALTS